MRSRLRSLRVTGPRIEVVWALYAAINLAVLLDVGDWEARWFHLAWVVITVVFGFGVWKLGLRSAMLGGVFVVAGVVLVAVIIAGPHAREQLREVPLVAALLFALIWHAERGHAAVDELQQTAERERNFVRDASHELRTPIAIARAVAQLGLQAEPGYDAAQDLAEIDHELRRLQRVAERLLLLATAEHDGGIALDAVEVEDVVVAAARRWSVTADRDWRVAAHSDALVSADRGRIDTVVDALVENALAATTDRDTIEFRARDDGRYAVIEVSDSGRGIAADLLPHVFERFVSSHSDGARGTGLGLPIVSAIITAHGGSVAIDSRAGAGTTVTLRLPREPTSTASPSVGPDAGRRPSVR